MDFEQCQKEITTFGFVRTDADFSAIMSIGEELAWDLVERNCQCRLKECQRLPEPHWLQILSTPHTEVIGN